MSQLRKILMVAGLGAGLMYFFDPDRGNRRRSLIRDQLIGAYHDTEELIEKGGRDLRNRAVGLAAEAKRMARREQVPDEVLVERVRSELGWAMANAGAIEVSSRNGWVTLRGPALASEVENLLQRAGRVPGVQGVDNQLEVHDSPGDIPGLQANRQRWAERRARMEANWAPGPRLLGLAAGSFLLMSGLIRRGGPGAMMSLSGLGLVTRSLANKPARHLVGLTDQPGAVTVHKGIVINAPVEEVFAFWRNFENFPQFMANVVEVTDLGDSRSRWVVKGPAGVPVSWVATMTRFEPNRLIEWRSEPGSTVQQAGSVHFQSRPEGGTQLDIQLDYTPPAGAIGHSVASLFGRNPKQQMDQDLARLKSLIEQGETTAEGAKVYYSVPDTPAGAADEDRPAAEVPPARGSAGSRQERG